MIDLNKLKLEKTKTDMGFGYFVTYDYGKILRKSRVSPVFLSKSNAERWFNRAKEILKLDSSAFTLSGLKDWADLYLVKVKEVL